MSNVTNLTASEFLKSPLQTTQYGWIWVGIGCAVMGNFCISLSFQLQRLAHKNNKKGVPYTKLPLWWLGLLFNAGGEVGNFLAYGMAPASVVSPLGAVTGKIQSHDYWFSADSNGVTCSHVKYSIVEGFSERAAILDWSWRSAAFLDWCHPRISKCTVSRGWCH